MDEALHPVKILLVEDNPGDIRLAQEALKEGKLNNELRVVMDGEEAIAFLEEAAQNEEKELPDLILLDLNLPKKNGREVLTDIKARAELRHIPVVVLTTSEDEMDINESYKQYASSYIVKPVSMNKFIKVIGGLKEYWFTVVKLPKN